MRTYFSRFFIAILFSSVIFSCKKSIIEPEPASVQTDLKDVSYGPNPAHKMDIYLPAGRSTTSTKLLVFIHGGSWSGGDKSEFNSAINEMRLQLNDYAIANINYRLAGNGANQNPAQSNDIQLALDFLQSNSTLYIINPNIIGLIGASAGGHLSLLHAYKFNSTKKIKGVVDLFGPTDLTDLYNNHPVPAFSQPVLLNYLGTTPAINPIIYQQTSPLNFVSNQSVPTVIFHGGNDIVVPISQSNTLRVKLQVNSVPVQMYIYPTEGHGWTGQNLTDTYLKSVTFIKQYIR